MAQGLKPGIQDGSLSNVSLPRQSYAVGVSLLILAVVGSSLSGMFVRLLPDLNGWQINCWRGYWMSVSVLVYLALRDGVGFGEAFRRIPMGASLAVTLFFAISSTCYVTALTLAPVANVSALVALSPIFVAALSRPVIGERVNTIIWSGTLLSVAGVIFVMRDGIENGHLVGNLVGLLVAVGFAGQTISLRRFRAFDIVPAIFFGGLLVFFVAGFVAAVSVLVFMMLLFLWLWVLCSLEYRSSFLL